MSVKIAVFAPIPSASDRIATVAKSGLRRRPRTAKRRSDQAVLICDFDGRRLRLVARGATKTRAAVFQVIETTYTAEAQSHRGTLRGTRPPRASRGRWSRQPDPQAGRDDRAVCG